MAAEWPDKHVSAIAVDLITRRCDPGAPLARKIPLPNQLRANYAYLRDGEVVRASTPISGVVIAQQNVLPRRLWRPDPGISGNDAPNATMVRPIIVSFTPVNLANDTADEQRNTRPMQAAQN